MSECTSRGFKAMLREKQKDRMRKSEGGKLCMPHEVKGKVIKTAMKEVAKRGSRGK